MAEVTLAPLTDTPRHNLWHYVWMLLRLRIRITISSFRHAKLRHKIGMIVVALITLIAFVGAFVLSWLLLGFLRSPDLAEILSGQGFGEVTSFLESMPGLILAGSLMGLLLTSFGVLLQALYLAGDMDFLLCRPLPIRAVFVAKLLQAILPNFSLVALFGLPVLLGLGAAGGYNILYYPLVFIVLAAMALAAAGLSSMLVMGVVRIFPARRVAEVLGFLGAILSITCSQIGNLFNATDLGEKTVSGGQIPLSMITRFNSPWSPLAWAGRGLVDIGEGRWLSGLGFLALTLGLSGGVFLLSLRLAERLYYTGWANIQVSTRKKKPVRAARPRAAPVEAGARGGWLAALTAAPAAVFSKVPSPVRAIFVKDLLMLRRDLRNLSQVITPIIFGLIYAVMLLRSGGEAPAGRGEAPDWFMQALQNLMTYGSVGISLFVGWSLLSRLAMMGFSQEGKQYWMLKSAPVRISHLLVAKFLVAYLPSLALGWAFLLLISLVPGSTDVLSTGGSILGFGLGVVALSIAGTAGVNLAFGVTGANLTWEDPRRMTTGWSGCLGALVSMIYLVFSLGLFFAPPVLLTGFGVPLQVAQTIGLLAGGAVSLACAIGAPLLVANRVARIGEV